jgi:hypothetical protein
MRFFKCLFEELLPPIMFWVNERKMKKDEEAEKPVTFQCKAYEGKSKYWLNETLDSSQKDALSLDDKTFKFTLSLALALTFLGTYVTTLIEKITNPFWAVCLTVSVGLSIFYILFGGFIAFGSMRTQKTYGKRRDAKTDTIDSLKDALRRQEKSYNRRHVRNEAAYQSLRNGFLLLISSIAIFFAHTLWAKFFPLKPPQINYCELILNQISYLRNWVICLP